MAREYDKLVRDAIPAVVEADGETPVTHVAKGAEYERRLFEKLEEEAAELREEPGVEELADVVEVVETLRRHLGIDESELEGVRAQKAAVRGRFDDGVVLERVED